MIHVRLYNAIDQGMVDMLASFDPSELTSLSHR